MRSKMIVVAVLLSGSIWVGSGRTFVHAQQTQTEHPIPWSIQLDHQETLERLAALAREQAPVGPAAQQALELFQAHVKREAEYILPPLALLPQLADGKVTADMRWAVTMADQVKAEREEIFHEHMRITDAMNNLAAAADRAHNTDALDFARTAVADSLTDIELMEPMTVVIGDYIRAKLPPAQ
jgi:hypothetical protein